MIKILNLNNKLLFYSCLDFILNNIPGISILINAGVITKQLIRVIKEKIIKK